VKQGGQTPLFHVLRRSEMEFTRPSKGDQTRSLQRLSPLLTTTRANVWRMPPGSRGRRHRETVQEELFVALEGAMMLLLGEPPEKVEVAAGSIVIVSTGTPIQLVNDGAEESLVLIVGAPPSGVGEYLPDVPRQ
jgi:quercetin dioxygenase-like cupin family protein